MSEARTVYWRQPLTIATNTFRTAIRDRVLHGIVLGAFVLVLSSLAIGKLSLENDARVIRDVGSSFINLTIVVVAIFSGLSLLTTELKHKTIYTIVTKPVSRSMFIVGKFLGLVLTLLVVELILGGVLGVIIGVRGDPYGVVLIQALILFFFEGVLVSAIATLLSSFSTPVTSGVITFGVFVLGRLRGDLYRYAELSPSEPFKWLVSVVGVIIPDLGLLRADAELADLIPLSWAFVAYGAGYCLFYSAIALVLACVLFSRRDFV